MLRVPCRKAITTLILTMPALVCVSGTLTARADTAITIDGTKGGRTFDGVGAISGGGGNSRLLIDYPEPQRSRILDYLFEPGYGANLQILKVEIGGDTNSTDGAEPSHEHTAGDLDCDRGYEWWLMEQAKARNPDIKLYGLAWGAPGWIGDGDFWSQDMIDYLMDWEGCAAEHGLTIDYLGGWNERGYDKGWYEDLHSAIVAKGYSTKVVGADSGWEIAGDVRTDPAFAQAVDVIGAHYTCGYMSEMTTCSSTVDAKATGKPLWASENGSEDDDSGAAPIVRAINRGYLDAKMTAYINWPLIASAYPTLVFNTTGLMVADQPWSGAYTVGASVWAVAHTTRFTRPGWKYIDSAGGYFGGDRNNGSYVTMRDPDGSDWSMIAETLDATETREVTFHVTGGLADGTVHVWDSDFSSADSDDYLVHTADLTPSEGTFSVTLRPGHVYTLTTTTSQGHGTATGPVRDALALPYSDDFDGYAPGTEARYLADMNGSWETIDCGAGRAGRCERQMAPTAPINWDAPSDPYTLLGDVGWSDYTVSTDVMLEHSGAARLIGRFTEQKGFDVAKFDAYYLQLSDTGHWSIVENDTSGTLTTLADGDIAAPGTGSWHNLALTFADTTITATVDGHKVGSATDSSYASGQVGLGLNGWFPAQFDNLEITPGTRPSLSGTYEIVNRNSGEVLDVFGESRSDGGKIVQWPYHDGANQHWKIVSTGDGYYTLVNENSGKVLEEPGSHAVEGLRLQQWTDNGGANQQWRIVRAGDGYVTLTNRAGGLLVDVEHASTIDGAPVIQWPRNNDANQQWKLIRVS